MKRYIFSVVIEDVDAVNEDEAFRKAHSLIKNGMYGIELIDTEEITD